MKNLLSEIQEIYWDKPIEFAQDLLGIEPTDQQKEVMRAFVDNRRVAVKAGHGVGKSGLESWLILWFMTTRPNCKIPCTAPTQRQLQDILWSEVQKWYQGSLLAELDLFECTKSRLSINHPEYKETWFTTPVSVSKPDNMQGFHADYIFFVVDEASNIPQEVMEVIEGALSSDHSYLLMCGNPTQTSGMFFDAFHKYKEFYKCLTLSCVDSPLVAKETIEMAREKYGENSNQFRVRILGEFPHGSEESIIKRNLVEMAFKREVNPDYEETIHIGVDVASRGGDKCTIVVRQGYKVIEMLDFLEMSIPGFSREVERIIHKYQSRNFVKVKIDTTGLGIGVFDILEEECDLYNAELVPIHFASKAYLSDRYANIGTEMFFQFADIIQYCDLIEDEDLLVDLTERLYDFDAQGRVIIEKKEKFRNRVGRSSDYGDACLLSFYEEEGYDLYEEYE